MAKLYTKKVWVNDQTKLSAKNLNHIENGIEAIADAIDDIEAQGGAHTHANKAILDAITAPFTTELKEKYDTVDSKSSVAVSTEGSSKEAVQYITIDGIEYKLAGSDIKYQELDNVSLDDLTTTGVYAITNALNVPANTSDKGTLVVTKLTDTVISQDWKSSINSAQRLFTPDATPAGADFKINGVVQEQGDINLTPGATYELEGSLCGSITIGADTDEPVARTKIILKGVNIQSDTASSIINYAPKQSKLVVEVANNTENYLVCNFEADTGNNDLGVINSENNLMITGVGYLTIINKKGHGVKASELIISGDVHMYLDTNHDAIHGGKLLKITGGYFEVKNANDAFSASTGSSNNGKLLIYGGTYVIHACKEAAFEGKSSSGVKRVLDSIITFGEGVNKLFNASNAVSDAYKIKVYQGLNTIVNNSGKTYTEVDMADDFTGAPSITDSNDLQVSPSGKVFNLTAAGDYKLSGNFSEYKIVTNPSGDGKINLILDNVYYNNSTETEPFIEHLSELKRIKFDNKDKDFTGKLCYIKKAHGNIIKSGKNIQFDGKTDVIINGCGTASCGLYTPAGYVLFANDALRKITRCETGICADNVRLGKDPDDILDGKYATGDTEIYLSNVIDITLTNQGSYENYHGVIIAPQYHTGISIIGRVNGEVTTIESQTGTIEGAGYTNSSILYLGSTTGGELVNVNSYTAPEGAKSTVPSVDPVVSSWVVYASDGYSKEAADEKFVAKSVYDALAAKVNATTPRTVEFEHEVVEFTSKGKPKTVKYDADGIIKSIIVSKYVCPEQVDDEPGNYLDDFLKEDRPVYARAGDFGYPEVDGTGQVNFEPEFADGYEGYVLVPTVTPATGYNKFKTQWCTGVPNNYRFTKVNSDISVGLTPVLESAMPAHTVTYKIIAPNTYTLEDLLQVRRFRCKDQVEKYVTYITGENPKPYNTLDANICSGDILVFEQDAEAPGEGLVGFTAVDKAYSDTCGLPSADVTEGDACAYFNVEGETQGLDTWSVAVSKGKVKTNKLLGFVVEEVAQNITITITIAPPVTVNYNDESVREVASGKVKYGFEMKNAAKELIYSEPKAKGSDFIFTVVRGYEIAAVDGETPRDLQEAISELIDSITVNGVEQTVSDVITKVEATKKKDNFTFAGDFVTGDVVITLKAKPVH